MSVLSGFHLRSKFLAIIARLLPVLLLLLLLLLALPGTVQALDFIYSTSGGQVTINRYTGPGGAVSIPDTINGLPVVSIGNSVFGLITNITSVSIPSSVTYIGGSAFSFCSGLASAIFAGNAPRAEYSAFYSSASGFTVYYTSGSTGFTAPTWNGYPAVILGAPPAVTTTTASGTAATTATLNGTVNPNGAATTAQFEYGLTTAYGSTASVTLSPANGTAAQPVSAVISGLQAGQTYHYRLTATNSGGTRTGANMTLVTPQPPPGPSGLEAPSIRLVGGNVELTVGQSVAGRRYQVQQSDTLAPGSWVDVAAERLGDGGPLVISTPHTPGALRRFYRLAQLQSQ